MQAEPSAQATLQKMVDLAVATVAGCDHAGVSIVQGGGFATPAASSDVPIQVDRIQYAHLRQGERHGVGAPGGLGRRRRYPLSDPRSSSGSARASSVRS